MVTLVEHMEKNVILLVIIVFTVSPVGAFFKLISTDYFLESTIVRYTSEINYDSSPLVHFFIQASAVMPGKFGEKIVERYVKFEIPLMLLPIREAYETKTCETCSRFKHVIAIFDSPGDVKPDNWRNVYKEIWNPGAHFAIFINDRSIDENSAERLLKIFWSLDCANVVIIASSHGGRIYAYDPFVIDQSKMRAVQKRNNGSYDKRGMVHVVNANDALFPEKLKNLRGRGIETSLYRHKPHANFSGVGGGGGTMKILEESASGMDVEILRYLAKRLNFTIRLKSGDDDATSHVVRLPGGKTVGPIGDIIIGKSEYLANGQFLEILYSHNASVDMIYPRLRAHSVVVVRRAAASPTPAALVNWLRGEDEKRRGMLAGVIGLFAIMIVYLRVLKKRTGGETLLAIICLLLFQHFRKIGRLTSDRIFCFAWIYCIFVVCTVYQGYLVKDLTSAPIFDNIETLRDLVDRTESLRLMVRPYERRILGRWAATTTTSIDKTGQRLYERAYVQLNFSACLAQMKDSTSLACSIDASYGKYALGQVRHYELVLRENPDARVIGKARAYLIPPIHIIEESLMDFWKTYFVRRGFPYLKLMNEAISRAVEFGLVDKWFRDDEHTRHFEEPPPTRHTSDEPRSLGLPHMDYTFAILIIGHVFATVVFISEIALARRAAHRR